MNEKLSNIFKTMGDLAKSSEKSATQKKAANPNIIRMSKCINPKGTQYKFRFLPNKVDPKNSIAELKSWVFNSLRNDGWRIFRHSPKNFGRHEKDPISDYKWEIWHQYRDGGKKDERKRKLFQSLREQSVWYANVYVMKDPVTPDNEGKVKILEFKKTVHDKLMEALTKDENDDEDTLSKYLGIEGVFDPVNGFDFVLTASPKEFPDENGDMIDGAEFSKSQFVPQSKKLTKKVTSPDGTTKLVELTDEEALDLLDQTHDIAAQFNIPSPEDVDKILHEHLIDCLIKAETQEEVPNYPSVPDDPGFDDDEIPGLDAKTKKGTPVENTPDDEDEDILRKLDAMK